MCLIQWFSNWYYTAFENCLFTCLYLFICINFLQRCNALCCMLEYFFEKTLELLFWSRLSAVTYFFIFFLSKEFDWKSVLMCQSINVIEKLWKTLFHSFKSYGYFFIVNFSCKVLITACRRHNLYVQLTFLVYLFLKYDLQNMCRTICVFIISHFVQYTILINDVNLLKIVLFRSTHICIINQLRIWCFTNVCKWVFDNLCTTLVSCFNVP